MKKSQSLYNKTIKYNIRIKDYFIHGIFFFFYGLVKYLPSPLGDYLRYLVVKPFCQRIGRVRIYEGVTFWFPYRIKIGNNVTLNEWIYLSGFGGLEIEDNVRIGHRTSILSSAHIYTNTQIPIYKQGLVSQKVKINKDVLIGCNVTILKGITIGQGAVIGAGSVVTKDIRPYEIVAGNPTKLIKSRKSLTSKS